MGFFDRLSRLVRANANAAVSGMEDPVKILDQSVADMQSDLVKLRQAVAIRPIRLRPSHALGTSGLNWL
jgi:phage shock protein A